VSTAHPRITLAYAQTLDGRIATRGGSSQWIGGAQSLEFAHRLRSEHDAIMVGIGTVLADNPRLTVRLVPGRDPLRVVVDSQSRISLHAAMLTDGAASGTLIATTMGAPASRIAALRELGATVVVVPSADGRVDLVALLRALHERDVRSVMVEGGAALITSLLRAQLVDEVAVTIAPKILGTGIEAVGDLNIAELAQAVHLLDMHVETYAPDIVVRGRIASRGTPHG
jgi:5-amino-6-(5-phosphoribosylamino)uracil reductase/diaminohydroxyphosphoribosylaminopyrimidine deaminase/5-amino-6-(5-phosphoribosylamino)uracil reductase